MAASLGRCKLRHAEPTILVARLQLPALTLCLVSAHGPHRAHKAALREQWWGLPGSAGPFDQGQDWLFFLDANARVGDKVSDSIGPWHADQEDDAGALLHELLYALRLHLPSTFPSS